MNLIECPSCGAPTGRDLCESCQTNQRIAELEAKLAESEKVVEVLAKLIAGEYKVSQMLFFGTPDFAIEWAQAKVEETTCTDD